MRKYTLEQKARQTELVRQRRAKWRAAGLCGKCGKNSAGETSYCVECQQKRKGIDAISSKRRRIKKLAAKVCVNCGNDSKCFTVTDNNSRQCRARWRTENRCSCGKPNAVGVLHCQECLDKHAAVRAANKAETMAAYGGKCVCCGEDDIRFLTIDHIHGDGNQHRLVIFGSKAVSGTRFYYWLLANHWPNGFQVLCFQCNGGKHTNKGMCPHQCVQTPEIQCV